MANYTVLQKLCNARGIVNTKDEIKELYRVLDMTTENMDTVFKGEVINLLETTDCSADDNNHPEFTPDYILIDVLEEYKADETIIAKGKKWRKTMSNIWTWEAQHKEGKQARESFWLSWEEYKQEQQRAGSDEDVWW